MLADDDDPMQALSAADRLNINYDSDDSSMQVDSDSPQNNMSPHDADADADVDAEGDSIHVSSPGDGEGHASSVAGPSSFAQRDSVRVFLRPLISCILMAVVIG
jgi:chromodomain-helicase-DNA-binding protein 1